MSARTGRFGAVHLGRATEAPEVPGPLSAGGVHPCSVCGGRVVLVLEDAPRTPGGWFNGLCAGCRTFAMAPPDSEVLP